jgi:hypothetical protein
VTPAFRWGEKSGLQEALADLFDEWWRKFVLIATGTANEPAFPHPDAP